MKNNKLAILAIITAIAVIWAFFAARNQYTTEENITSYGKFLKDLQGNVDQVANVVILHKGKQFQVTKTENGWVFPAKNDYPIEINTIRNLILSAENLEIIEKKTDKRENFEALGLVEPEGEKSESLRVILTDEGGQKTLADFIRGNNQTTATASNVISLYVRNTNEDQAWVVRSDSPIKLSADSLFNKTAYKIAASRIKNLTIANKKGGNLNISRANPGQDFSIMATTKKAKDPVHINNIATMLEKDLTFLDAAPAGAKQLGNEIANDVFETFDGLKISLKIFSTQDGKWVKIFAESRDESKKNEADAINSIAKDWIYRVSDSSSNMLLSELDKLVE